MVNERGVPVHPNPPLVKRGVTETVAITGTGVVLMALNEKIVPFPLAASPMEVEVFVQLKVVPVTGLPKKTAAVLSRSQRI